MPFHGAASFLKTPELKDGKRGRQANCLAGKLVAGTRVSPQEPALCLEGKVGRKLIQMEIKFSEAELSD